MQSDYSVGTASESNIFGTSQGCTNEELEAIRQTQNASENKRLGFTCSAFDLLHTGHALMLKDARDHCDFLVVGLHTDPTLNRPDTKNKPVQSFIEREEMIKAIRYVDMVVHYATEDDLIHILKTLKPDVRILGTDWKGKSYTGCELPIEIYWHERDHPWSTTHLRQRVHAAEVEKMKSSMNDVVDEDITDPTLLRQTGRF